MKGRPPPTRSNQASAGADPALELLVSKAKMGDSQSVGELTRRYRADIVRYLEWTIAQDAPDLMSDQAEDIAQELFASLGQKLKGYEESGLFQWWLQGVAYNLFRTALRSRIRRRKRIGEDTLGTGRDAGPSETTSIFSTKKEALRAAAQSLPGGDRAAWELYAHGFTPAEIATRLEIEPNAVHQRLNRARRKLMEWLAARYGGEA